MTDPTVEAVARAIKPWVARDNIGAAEAAIAAHLAALEAQGMVVVPREATDAMQRAWSLAVPWREDVDPDAQVPVPGTGQGDLQYCHEWQIPWHVFDLWTRQEAMIAAWQKETAE